MNFKLKNWLIALVIVVFIISFAVCFVLFNKWFYYLEITFLDLVNKTGYSYKQIKDNYSLLIDYQSLLNQGPLVLPDFKMSQAGIIHFQEVKNIFSIVQGLMIISFFSSLYLIIKERKKGEFYYLHYVNKVFIGIFIFFGILAFAGFDNIFVWFHRLVFRNEYWIFDPMVDPVINILPQEFFFHSFLFILGIILISWILINYLYQKKKKMLFLNHNGLR